MFKWVTGGTAEENRGRMIKAIAGKPPGKKRWRNFRKPSLTKSATGQASRKRIKEGPWDLG